MPSTNNRFLKWVRYGRNFGEVLTTRVWIIEKLTVVEMTNEREMLHGKVTLRKVLTGLLTVRVVRLGSGRGKWSLWDGKLSRTTKNCLIIKGACWLDGDGVRRLEMFQLSGIMEGKRWKAQHLLTPSFLPSCLPSSHSLSQSVSTLIRYFSSAPLKTDQSCLYYVIEDNTDSMFACSKHSFMIYSKIFAAVWDGLVSV